MELPTERTATSTARTASVTEKSISSVSEADIQEMVNVTENFRSKKEMIEMYSKLRNEREKTTFAMMMRMNPEALTNVRREFFMRSDRVNMHEFIYIIQKHLSNRSSGGDQRFELNTKEKREFALNICQLFKEIDVNGDGGLEWQVCH